MKKLFQRTGVVLMIFIMVMTGFHTATVTALAAEKTGLYEGQPAKFSYGSSLKTADGQTYQFTGKDLNWMQMYCYNYQTGQPYTGGARELAGPLERYRIKTSAGSFVGYCIEHGVMVDESLQLKAADYRNAVITAGLGETVMQNIKLCLFYGRQNGDSISDLLNSPENGGLGFRESEYYGKNASSYTLDDWEMATVMLIRESQQKFRDSKFRLKSGGNGLSYTNGWRGSETGKINSDHYVNPLKGKAAYDIYKYMEQLCQDHFLFSASIASMNPLVPKNISFGADDRDDSGNYYKKVSVSASRAYPLKAVDKDNPAKEAEGVAINLIEEEGKYFYEILVEAGAFTEGAVFGLVKVMPGRVPTNDLLVWECETTNGHLQAITTGMADPLQGYFSLSTKAEPVEGEPPEPEYFPTFEFPVSKVDLNPGWDGSIKTPMGDAALGATYVLYRDGTEVDRVTLDAYGSSAVLADQPWTAESDFACQESGETALHLVDAGGDPPEQTDHGCGTVTPTKVEWSGSHTYTISEIAPDGRFIEPDAYAGQRSYTVSYYAVTEDERQYACETPAWKDIEYTVDYVTVTGSGSGGESAGPGTADSLDEILTFSEEVFVNDCCRGKITLSKSLEREDVFKDSALGGHPDSTNSRWKLYLSGGGYEDSAYVRFIREKDLTDGTAVYRVTRDASGTDNASESMAVGSNGDMVVYDIPYGTYWMEEAAADDVSFVREKFLVEIGEHHGSYTPQDDYDNRYDYNIRDKKITNRVKFIKTDSETGKGVDLSGTKFYIRYKGSPLNSDEQNQKLENYNRYLPNAAEITSEGPYTFEADENGGLTLQYQLPYGIYEIIEWQVPEGYYIEGEGNTYTFTVDEQPVHVDGNFGQLVTYDGQITAADPSYDSAQYPYTVYYQAVSMENKQVKGSIIIEKTGEILTGFMEETVLGQKVFRPVYEMAGKLKDAVFGIFAAEDILLSDGNDGPKIYDALTDEELVIPEAESTHYGAPEVYEAGSMTHNSGAILSYYKERESGHGGTEGEDNHYTRVYVSPEQKDTTYSYTYETSDEICSYLWDVNVTMNYQAGGRNVTDVEITKTTLVRSGYVDEILLTLPEGTVYENGEPAVISPLQSHISGNVAPDEERRSNSLSVYENTEITESQDGQQEQAEQTYIVSFVQEADNNDGFSVNWDDFSITARAEQTNQTAVTTITSQGASPIIDCGIGYTYVQEGSKTTFTAAEPKSPVYFLSADDIRTEMYYFGGYMKAMLEIPQSAVDKDFESIMPDMGFDWYTNLTPSDPVNVFQPVRGTTVTAIRHENSETGKAESYTVEIISSQTIEEPFGITFADGYTMSLFTDTAESGNGVGVMVLEGIYKTTRYTLSELVETIRTDENGRAESSLLPLGKYIVRELQAPEGYIRGEQETLAEIKYENQAASVVWTSAAAQNDYVTVEIELKKLFETSYSSGEFESGGEAVFGIYTAQKIESDSGESIDKDTLIHMFSTDRYSTTHEAVKLPLGYTYYIREIFAPGDYELNDTPFYFTVKDYNNAYVPEFSYPQDGISGNIIMESSGHAVITAETLTRYPDISKTAQDKISPDRVISAVDAAEGSPAEIILANGKKVWVSVEGNTFDYVIDGTAGTYIPDAAVTGYFASFIQNWDAAGLLEDTVTDEVVFYGPGSDPVIVKAEVTHTSYPESKFKHAARITDGIEEYELGASEKASWLTADGTQVFASLDSTGSLTISMAGSVEGKTGEAEAPRVFVNGAASENIEFYKSVTLARQSSSADTIQVKINTLNDIDAGAILNMKKEHPDNNPVPEFEWPQTPDKPQESPQPEEEPEDTELEIPEKIVEEVPETGESPVMYFWILTAATALAGIVYMNIKEKRRI